jgi:hypothetical protein
MSVTIFIMTVKYRVTKPMRNHIKHFMKTILSILLFLSFLPQITVGQDEWKQITDTEAGFTISFPAKPIYEQSADLTLSHQTEKYKFYYSGRYMQIIFASLNKPIRTPMDFSDAFTEITRVQANDGILLRQVKLPDGGRQYDNVTTDATGTAYHRTRVYIRNERYYAISFSMYATRGLDEREAEQFFSTFRFIGNISATARRKDRRTNKSSNGKAQDRNWYMFRSPNGDFTVDFPGKPEYREFPNPETGIPDHKYYFHLGENTFIVSYREEPTAATQPEEILQRALQRAIDNSGGWRVLQNIKLQRGGYYIESQGVVDGIPVYMRTKLYLRGNRFYHVSTLTQNLTGPNKEDVVRFLSSFRLL